MCELAGRLVEALLKLDKRASPEALKKATGYSEKRIESLRSWAPIYKDDNGDYVLV